MNDGDAQQFNVEVTAPANASAGQTSALTFRVEADPTSETNAIDVVKATWNVVAPTPDLAIRAEGGAWQGAAVMNADGANQTVERVAKPGATVRGQIKLSVAEAQNGQSVRWSVPDWDAFRADGWDAKFFDAPQGGSEITGLITGEGWTTRHTDGFEPIIGWEMKAPEGASDVTRVLGVRAQVGAGASDAVRASVRVLPNVRPDVAIRHLENGFFVGENVYSPTDQPLELVVAVENTERFLVKITNPTNATAQFLFEPPTNLPKGWSYKLTNELGEDVTTPDSENQGLVTPPIEPYQSIEWFLSLDTNALQPRVTLPVRFSGAGAFDECQLKLQLQGIAGAEYSLDGGANWQIVEDNVLTVPKGSTVGFNAIPLFSDVPWPDDPFEPTWSHQDEAGKDQHYYGEKVFLYHPTPTLAGAEGETVRVACGNDFTVKVKVKAEEEPTTP